MKNSSQKQYIFIHSVKFVLFVVFVSINILELMSKLEEIDY